MVIQRQSDLMLDSQFGETDPTEPKWYSARLPFHTGGTTYATLEEVLNSLASDYDSLRATSIRLDVRIEIWNEHSALFRVDWVALAWIYCNAALTTNGKGAQVGVGPFYAFNGLMAANSAKGLAVIVARALPGGKRDFNSGSLQEVSFSRNWKFPNTEGRLFCDDEGQTHTGYRTCLALAYGCANTRVHNAAGKTAKS
jgi:hypothetical protein